jgi:hypothetical protein
LRSFRSFNEKSLQVAGGNKAGNGLVDLFCVKFFSINLLIKGRVSGIFLFQAVVGKTFLQRESAFFWLKRFYARNIATPGKLIQTMEETL